MIIRSSKRYMFCHYSCFSVVFFLCSDLKMVEFYFISDIQAIIDCFLETGIILITSHGEKVFYNNTKIIRNFGGYKRKKLAGSCYYYVQSNKCYLYNVWYDQNNEQHDMYKLVNDDFVLIANESLYESELSCIYADSVYKYKKYQLYKLTKDNEQLIGEYLPDKFTAGSAFDCSIIFCFEHKIFLYAPSRLKFFDLKSKQFIECPKPPMKICNYGIHNWIIFNRCFYIFGKQVVQYYNIDKNQWVCENLKKNFGNIIACLSHE